MIIKSLLDNDFYKFTMMQAVYHKFNDVIVKYKFKCRNLVGEEDKYFNEIFIEQVSREISNLDLLYFEEDEIKYLNNIPFLKEDFVDFLSTFRLNSKKYVKVFKSEGEGLNIEIQGPWINTILFEVPILSIVQQLGSECVDVDYGEIFDCTVLPQLTELKSNVMNVAEFGTRRRYSYEYHKYVLERLIGYNGDLFNFIGTSNVLFSKQFKIKAIGTMAHEFIQAMQGLTHPILSQKMAFDSWCKEYHGSLGIALSDTFPLKNFLFDFSGDYSRLYDGVRHDSGDPFTFAEKMISFYEKNGIDPKTKTIIFSDSLDIRRASEINDKFHGKIKMSFGIGTFLTNFRGSDIMKYRNLPKQNVIKLVECNYLPVAKISNNLSKTMCEDEYYLRWLWETLNNNDKFQ